MDVKRSPVHVHIQNFQSIEDLEIVVDGFTCITGPTNIGKSAIMRSISGALKNIPVVGLVRRGAKFCSVKIKSEGWGFIWEKGAKSVNRYWPLNDQGEKIKDSEGNPVILDKIGQGQIEEIAKIGFGSVKIGDEVIFPWYADQFTPVFLLNKSGPAVTDFFSEVAHLKVLQDAVVLCARRRKWALDEAKTKGDELVKLREKESKIDDLDSLIHLTEELQQQIESVHQYEARIDRGNKHLAELDHIRDVLLIIGQNVKIPNDLCAPVIEKLKRMHHHWVGLEDAAHGLRVIRAVSEMELSENPEREFVQYSKISKFADLPELQRSVSILEDIDSVKVPNPKIQVSKLKLMEDLDQDIKRLQQSVLSLSTELSIPSPDIDVSKLLKIETLEREISQLQTEQSQLELKSKDLGDKLLVIQTEIDTIPSCDACGRPTLMEHSHEGESLSM